MIRVKRVLVGVLVTFVILVVSHFEYQAEGMMRQEDRPAVTHSLSTKAERREFRLCMAGWRHNPQGVTFSEARVECIEQAERA